MAAVIGAAITWLARSRWAPAAAKWAAVGFAVLLFLLSVRRAGERAGWMVERREQMEKVKDIESPGAGGGGSPVSFSGRAGAAAGGLDGRRDAARLCCHREQGQALSAGSQVPPHSLTLITPVSELLKRR